MHSKTVIGFCIGLFVSFQSVAQVDSLKLQADQAYIDGDYDQAIELYGAILGQEMISAEVEYNLGNAYFKSGQIAPAILHYERALRLAPDDEDIRFNLRLANMQVKDRVDEMPELFFVKWGEKFMRFLTVDGWAWSVVISFILSIIGFLAFRFLSQEGLRRLAFFMGLIALIWSIFSGYAAQHSYANLTDDPRAVLLAPTVNAKSEPQQNGKVLFVIHEGLVVEVVEERNGWSRIRLTNGSIGWIRSDQLIAIRPESL